MGKQTFKSRLRNHHLLRRRQRYTQKTDRKVTTEPKEKNPTDKRDGINKKCDPPADNSSGSELDVEDVVHDATGITSPIGSSGTPRKNSRQSLGSAEKNNHDSGIIALIQHAVRDATYAISPSSERLRPFMYWNADKKTACAKMLIKRTTSLQLVAENYPRNAFARLYAKVTGKATNNERSTQIRQLKLVFVDDKSPFCMISDYKMGGTSNATIQKEMRISSSLRDEFDTIDDLRDALIAGSMYKYPLLFDLFCGGLESGKVCGIPKMDVSPIEDIINVAHKAHFRLELWYAMVNLAYRHEPSKVQRTSRHEKHTTLCALVLWHWNAVNLQLMHLNTEVPYTVARKHTLTAAATTIRACPKNFINRTFKTSSSYDLGLGLELGLGLGLGLGCTYITLII